MCNLASSMSLSLGRFKLSWVCRCWRYDMKASVNGELPAHRLQRFHTGCSGYTQVAAVTHRLQRLHTSRNCRVFCLRGGSWASTAFVQEMNKQTSILFFACRTSRMSCDRFCGVQFHFPGYAQSKFCNLRPEAMAFFTTLNMYGKAIVDLHFYIPLTRVSNGVLDTADRPGHP